ncbi:CPBP family intramembrane metalloprotease [Bifidobacterium amazonense]|uniref:CPBP family intramembrane metalloprotease n=1 Tax=Bifidobacterium amazonense TaxID=2809027 RepID=A0ABS9VTJ5_9BIFI|nr:CPBP family intramembrane glutamic endopeptidase [Bifidobacterium amazonense]MCH9275430.1 CPBP family intramembrane metalloprotease [Bifidobacterium amazonense]
MVMPSFVRVVASVLRDELSIDRTDLKPVEQGRLAAARLTIIPLIIVIMACGLGRSIIDSVRDFLSYTPSNAAPASDVIGLDDELGYALNGLPPVIFGVLACVAMHLLRLPAPSCPHRQVGARTGVLAFFVAFIPLTLNNVLLQFAIATLHLRFFDGVSLSFLTPFGEGVMMVGTAAEGLVEEPLVLGLVAVGLRRCKVPWTAVAVVAIVLRISLHLYYGPAIVSWALWPLLYVMLYRRIGSIVPMILAHGVYDLSIVLDEWWLSHMVIAHLSDRLMPALAWVGAVIVVVVIVRRTVLRLRAVRAAKA